MKSMTMENMVEANGGAWTHCARCGKNFWRITQKAANLAAYYCHGWWGYGKFSQCKTKNHYK